jgi:hypothetical protein
MLVETSSDLQVIKSVEKAADSISMYLSSPCCQFPGSIFCRFLVKMQVADTARAGDLGKLLSFENRRRKSELLLLMTFSASPLVVILWCNLAVCSLIVAVFKGAQV